MLTRALSGILVAVTLLALSACGSRDRGRRSGDDYLGGFRPQQQSERANFDNVSYWDGDGARGSSSIKIDLSEQRAYFYKGGEMVGVSVISTGREGFDTPSGNYKIIQKDADHKSNLYGDYVTPDGSVIQKDVDRKKDPMPAGAVFDGAKMPYFMRITGGIGMHQGFLPGYAASHGCIRMPRFMAKAFFENVAVGTPVTVVH
jgi:lipoprotein-anchoring transpeptidase ErfK/SrfK